ncbi:MAG TPA: hypothetical protein VKY85_05325 [Candidatus Angelobacter sp.]|nr:hypothetical protein [Candidatus Angelobacter sp.]
MTTGKLIVFHRTGSIAPKSGNAQDFSPSHSGWSISAIQQSLFPLAKSVIIPSLSEEVGVKLPDLLQQIRPAYVFDCRSVPRFDFGIMSRAQVFECFHKYHSKYIDLARMPQANWYTQIIKRASAHTDRPIMILVAEHSEQLEHYIVQLIADNLDWSIHKISKDLPSWADNA